MNPRRRTVDAAGGRRRRDPDAAEKWTQRNLDAISEMPDHALRIERDDADLSVGKILRNGAGARTERVVSIRNRQLDLLDAHLEHIARLRAFNEDRPGENMPTRSFVRH